MRYNREFNRDLLWFSAHAVRRHSVQGAAKKMPQQSQIPKRANFLLGGLIPMDQPLPLAVAQEESNPHQERGQLVCNTPLIRIMTEQLPLTDPFFATEQESNIMNNMNDRVLPIPMDPPLPLAVAQESRPDQEMAQLVLSPPHRPRWRMEGGEMVCGTLGERVCVLQENILPLPVQATTQHRGHCDELVCPPLVRNGGAEMWLRQAEMVCGSVLTSHLSYEEGSEVVCCGVEWGRTAQTLPHQTSNTTVPSSVVWNNLGAIGTLQNTTHHYIPQLLPSLRETTTPNAPVAVNAHFSCECHSLEECRPKSGIPREAVGDPPPTQQLVTGRMT